MRRALVIINGNDARQRVARWAQNVPTGTRIEFKAPRRSLDQNSLFWGLLTDVSRQKQHFGRTHSPELWKSIFMHAWGREVRFIPSLDGDSVIPIAYSSSDLSKAEMTDLIEFIIAWGAQNGVSFSYLNEDAPA